jgi:Bacterial TSP3 repeat
MGLTGSIPTGRQALLDAFCVWVNRSQHNGLGGRRMRSKYFLWLAVVVGIVMSGRALAQINSFNNASNGTLKWETSSNWSLGAPASGHSAFITNGVGGTPHSRTVVVDSTTVGSGTMTVSNLTVAVTSPGIGFNSLFLNNAGSALQLLVRDSLTIAGNGFLSITNSRLEVHKKFVVDSSVTLNTGTIDTYFPCSFPCFPAAADTIIGNTKTGAFAMAQGRWNSGPVQLGSSASTYGTLTIGGGSITMATGLAGPIHALDVVNGTVWLLGGDLQTLSEVKIGDGSGGAGQMTVTNGTWTTSVGPVIGINGGVGTLTIAGGSVVPSQIFVGGLGGGSAGAIWQTGGQFVAGDIRLGSSSSGQMTISNGTTAVAACYLGWDAGASGTLNVAGGSFEVYGDMHAGFYCASVGLVNITGGSLNITNGTGTAFLEVGGGTLTLSGGTLRADKIVATNTCAHFLYTGGTLISTNVMLNPNDDSDGDGMSNGYEQTYNLAPLNPADAGNDNDGDGLSNLQEFQAGTDPTNSASFLGITSITQTSTNILVTWMTASGKTNALERTAGVAGTFSNNFSVVTNIVTTGTTTNYLDVGAATNTPAFYYRVRLVP